MDGAARRPPEAAASIPPHTPERQRQLSREAAKSPGCCLCPLGWQRPGEEPAMLNGGKEEENSEWMNFHKSSSSHQPSFRKKQFLGLQGHRFKSILLSPQRTSIINCPRPHVRLSSFLPLCMPVSPQVPTPVNACLPYPPSMH